MACTHHFQRENQIHPDGPAPALYSYDGEGRRMKKTVGGETTYFFHGVGRLYVNTTTNTGAVSGEQHEPCYLSRFGPQWDRRFADRPHLDRCRKTTDPCPMGNCGCQK